MLKRFRKNLRNIYQKLRIEKIKLQVKLFTKNQFSSVHKSPIFVLGNQKTGSTAIVNLLGEATQKTHISDFFHYYQNFDKQLFFCQSPILQLQKKYKYFLSHAFIKEPSLSFYLKEILHSYPKSHIVFIIRDPRHNIRSILNRLKLPGNLSDYLITEKDKINGNITSAWMDILYSDLHYEITKDYITNLARRCQASYDIYCDNINENLHLVRYEDFLVDKRLFIETLVQKLELKVQKNIDAIKDVQFQPKGSTNTDINLFFGSKNIKKIEQYCTTLINDYY